MDNFNKYDFFIFDCDGVILNSNSIKTEAFRKVLINEVESDIEKFIHYHESNGGISRYEKFNYFYSKIINKKEKLDFYVKRALNDYGKIVFNELIKCDFVPGVIDFINHLFKNKKNIFVVSGSDQQELREVFRNRNISFYFEKIYGSPNHKVLNTGFVVNRFKNKEKGVFFGDSKLDYESSVKHNLDFFFIDGFSDWHDGNMYVNEKFIKTSFEDIL